jgi:hypothetical protein
MILIIYAAKMIKIDEIAVSFLRIWVFIIWYASKIVCKLLFWRIFNFLLIVLRAVLISCGIYHTDALNIIAGLIIEKYISLIILKLAFYINIEIWLITRLCVANFFSILIMYDSYFNLKSTYTSNILMWSVVIFSIPLILIVAYILKSFDLLAKCISLYFFEKNFMLCVFNHFSHFVWILLSVLQLRLIEFSYIKIYVLFMKANDDVYNASLFIISSRSVIKKRKCINKIDDFYKILIFIFINSVFSS